MPHRKKQQKDTPPTPPSVTPVFDTALPSALKHIGLSSSDSPSIHTTPSPLSPFVVKLSHADSLASEAASKEAAISSLMHQLQHVEEEAPLTSSEPEVLVDFLDLAEQVREDLPAFSDDLRTPIHAPDETAWETALPLTHSTSVAPEFIFDALLADAADQEDDIVEDVYSEEEEGTLIRSSFFSGFFNSFNTSSVFGSIHYRMSAAFLGLSLLFVMPLHAMQSMSALPEAESSIVAEGTRATSLLQEGGSALLSADFSFAETQFEEAHSAFTSVQGQIREATRGIGLIASVIPQSKRALQTSTAVVTIGESFSESARLFSRAIADINAQESLAPTEKIAIFDTYLERIIPQLERASEALPRIDTRFIPEEQRIAAESVFNTAPLLLSEVTSLRDSLAILNTILGHESQQSYLLVFQNTAELRATGGFMGSFAEVTLDQGAISDMYVPKGGTYDVQGQLSAFLAPPEPLGVVNPRWEFQDANWFPDFRISARNILDFHEATGGPTMDGVIAINSSLLPSVLAVTGPLVVSGKELNAENVLFELQKRDEEPLASGEPKALLSDLTEELFTYIESADTATLLALSDVLFQALSERDIQLFMKDQQTAVLVHDLHWDGSQLPYSFDTLQVVSSNIGGGKSDIAIDQHIDMQVSIDEQGRAINTVTITKTHRGIASTVVKGEENKDYIRLYVPEGSELLSAEGFDERPLPEEFDNAVVPLELTDDLETVLLTQSRDEATKTDIWDENGFTVFGNWIYTKPGETEVVRFQYALPDSLVSDQFDPEPLQQLESRLGVQNIESYSFVLQPQSGVSDRTFSFSLSYPPSWKQLWSNAPQEPLETSYAQIIQSLFLLP